MKIAQVSHTYLPHLGGIEFYVKRLADDLKKQNIGVDVLTTDMDTSKDGRKEEAKYFKTSFSFMRNPFSLEMLKYLKNNSYDIIHVHNVWFLPSLESVILRRKAKIITTMHGVYPDNSNWKLRLFLNLYKPFAKYILNKSYQIIVLSNSEKEKLMSIFKINPEKIVVIPNGIQIQNYKRIKKDNIILFTGRIIPDKNPDLLIKAAGILNNKFKDFKIVFIGPIEERYKSELENIANKLNLTDKIVFIPSLDQSNLIQKKELMNFYKESKIFISIGSWEGLPTRSMEAMQFETPCITYSSGGSSELVIDNFNGFVISSLDEKLLVEKIYTLMTNKKLAEKFGKNARKTIKKDFDWEKLSEKILNIYKMEKFNKRGTQS